RDYGAEIEVVSGLAAGARIVVHPGDDLPAGTVVEPVEMKQPSAPATSPPPKTETPTTSEPPEATQPSAPATPATSSPPESPETSPTSEPVESAQPNASAAPEDSQTPDAAVAPAMPLPTANSVTSGKER